MIKEAIGSGSTIDEAKEAALLDLCAAETDDIQFEIISFPKKKTLGLFGGSLAQVRAYVELPDPKPAKKPANNNNNKKDNKKNAPKPEKKVAKVTREEVAEVVEGVPASELSADSPAVKAVAYLKNVLAGLGSNDLTFTVAEANDGAKITISGDDTGVIIGHRGETLDALQYLASLAATKKGSGYYRVVLNIGNYRQKREKTLEGVAKKTAAYVLKTGKSRSLEPMNPYERRIIHTTVQTIEGVTSNSIGGGSARRVVISLDGERKAGNGYKNNKPSAPVSTKTDKTVDSASTPLYGRIN